MKLTNPGRWIGLEPLRTARQKLALACNRKTKVPSSLPSMSSGLSFALRHNCVRALVSHSFVVVTVQAGSEKKACERLPRKRCCCTIRHLSASRQGRIVNRSWPGNYVFRPQPHEIFGSVSLIQLGSIGLDGRFRIQDVHYARRAVVEMIAGSKDVQAFA